MALPPAHHFHRRHNTTTSISSRSNSSSNGNQSNNYCNGNHNSSMPSSTAFYHIFLQSPFCMRCNRFTRRLWRDLQVLQQQQQQQQQSTAGSPSSSGSSINNDKKKGKQGQSQRFIFGLLALLLGFVGIVSVVMGGGSGGGDYSGSGFLRSGSSRYARHYHQNHHNKKAAGASFASSLPSVLPPRLDATELNSINEQLAQMSLEQVLQWAHSAAVTADHRHPSYKYPLVDVTSFGASGMVLLHKLHQLGYAHTVPIITIDTLHLFPETYEFIEKFKANGKTEGGGVQDSQEQRHAPPLHDEEDKGGAQPFTLPLLKVYRPKGQSSKAEFDKVYGADLYKTNPEKYAYLSKVEPTLRALQEHDARIWITGRRRSQGGERGSLAILEVDDSAGEDHDAGSKVQRFKLNPLAFWTYDDVWKYIHEHKVPYNPLHDQGYKSIGDTMTTQPVDGVAEERSGRFVGMGRTECGIHSTRAKIQKMLAEAAAASQKTNNVSSSGANSGFFGRLFGSKQESDGSSGSDESDSSVADSTAPLPCSGCLELVPKSLVDVLQKGTTDLLIEFHSPLCGHCRQFAPTYEEVALELMPDTNIEVARFDITYNDVPKEAQDLGLVVELTPTLFFIQRLPEFKVIQYNGSTRRASAILEWVKSSSSKL